MNGRNEAWRSLRRLRLSLWPIVAYASLESKQEADAVGAIAFTLLIGTEGNTVAVWPCGDDLPPRIEAAPRKRHSEPPTSATADFCRRRPFSVCGELP